MSDSKSLTPPEERVEEIRAIRRRLFSGVGTDYAKLREMGNRCPEGYRVLRGVRPITPLALQLEDESTDRKDR
jgi:hypothetical protein